MRKINKLKNTFFCHGSVIFIYLRFDLFIRICETFKIYVEYMSRAHLLFCDLSFQFWLNFGLSVFFNIKPHVVKWVKSFLNIETGILVHTSSTFFEFKYWILEITPYRYTYFPFETHFHGTQLHSTTYRIWQIHKFIYLFIC